MAIQLDTQNIDDYPGTIKRVTVDQVSIVPTGYEGDEQYVIKVSTSAYSDNEDTTAILPLYITDFDIGWSKSSGLTGIGGRFVLDSDNHTLKIKMDSTISGSDGSGYYDLDLAYDTEGIALRGEEIASDLEQKIRSITVVEADTGYQLAYTNASVEFTNGKFWITSGTIGRHYTGEYKSAVSVISGATGNTFDELGFNLAMTSEGVANTTTAEALLTVNYTTGDASLNISAGTGVAVGNSVFITDGTSFDYFTVLSVNETKTILTVPTSATNSYVGITHDYTVTSGTKIQVLKEQDPDNFPTSWCSSVDSIIRYGIKSMVNLIDYSS